MSIAVQIGDLARALGDFGDAYLVTVSTEGLPKAVLVEAFVEDGQVVVRDVGRGSLRNITGNPATTLVFASAHPKGFTLLVDGTGESRGADLLISPTGAVLHRPGRHADGPPPPPSAGGQGDACRNECAPIV